MSGRIRGCERRGEGYGPVYQAAAGAVVTLHTVGLTDDGKFTAMARFQHSVVINRSAERVFAFVSDFENDPPWSGVA